MFLDYSFYGFREDTVRAWGPIRVYSNSSKVKASNGSSPSSSGPHTVSSTSGKRAVAISILLSCPKSFFGKFYFNDLIAILYPSLQISFSRSSHSFLQYCLASGDFSPQFFTHILVCYSQSFQIILTSPAAIPCFGILSPDY